MNKPKISSIISENKQPRALFTNREQTEGPFRKSIPRQEKIVSDGQFQESEQLLAIFTKIINQQRCIRMQPVALISQFWIDFPFVDPYSLIMFQTISG
jgi:hypothetical protein